MGDRHRWIKFWPQDWQRDPALRSCGIAARGLWIDLLCLAHDAEPYGHILINGRPASMRQIGSIAGITEKEAGKLVAELELAGVFSRTKDGVIFSRRMLRDDEASRSGREAVNRRWGQSNTPPNTPPNGHGIRKPKRNGSTTPDSLESESESDSPPTPPHERGGLAEGKNPRANPVLAVVRSDGVEVRREAACRANGFNGWEDGREVVGGYFWDDVLPRVLEAAAMDGGDTRQARLWLRDGIIPDQFLPVIRQIAERADYQPPRSLAYFDRPVRAPRMVAS